MQWVWKVIICLKVASACNHYVPKHSPSNPHRYSVSIEFLSFSYDKFFVSFDCVNPNHEPSIRFMFNKIRWTVRMWIAQENILIVRYSVILRVEGINLPGCDECYVVCDGVICKCRTQVIVTVESRLDILSRPHVIDFRIRTFSLPHYHVCFNHWFSKTDCEIVLIRNGCCEF